METKDTKQQHPAEPWRIVPTQFASISIYAADNDELPVANTASNGSPKNFGAAAQQRREATARRIVACVNACEGLPQDALDGGWTAMGMSAYAKGLEQQRDKLLALLKRVYPRAISKDYDEARFLIAEIEAAK